MTEALYSHGVSDAARYIAREASQHARFLHKSAAFGIESVVRDQLGDVWEECSQPNWDGYGALPVSNETLRNAYILLESLPLGFPRPSIAAEPDGQITLEWHCSPKRTLSISVTAEGDLHYAALIGPSRNYGTEPFFGELPRTIVDLVTRVIAGC